MTLGNRLAATLREIDERKLHAADLRTDKDREKLRKERLGKVEFIATIIAHTTRKIDTGLVPSLKIDNYASQKWIRAAIQGKAQHQDLWNDLTRWAADAELEIVIREENDGAGICGWITITAIPARNSA